MSWNEELQTFEWIKNVKALGTNKARLFLRDNIREWIKFNHSWDPLSGEMIFQKNFHLMSNMSFFYETADENFKKFTNYLINNQYI